MNDGHNVMIGYSLRPVTVLCCDAATMETWTGTERRWVPVYGRPAVLKFEKRNKG